MSRHQPEAPADRDRRVRLEVYRHFAATGDAPAPRQLAEVLDLPVTEVHGSLIRLAEARALALSPDSTAIWMAHPFSAVPTAYRVRTAERTYWANCAWDALGVPAVLGVDAATSTRCADCGEPLLLRVEGGEVVDAGGSLVHFVVPPVRFWDDVGFT